METAPPLIVRVNSLVAVEFALSVTWAVKVNVPVVVGVPVKSPIVVREIPSGRSPGSMTAQFLYGVTPPVAASTSEYGTPIVPAGREDAVMILNPDALMLNVKAFDRFPPGLATVTLALPAFAIRLADTEAVNWLPLT
jgi:hypothetical protein